MRLYRILVFFNTIALHNYAFCSSNQRVEQQTREGYSERKKFKA
ncbi:hypothetical protein HMPREF1586_01202 [Gardnerella vaginalis JCP8522]|nr:hypothetical protein HMPREF1586_01202 [Gardnerella vaginalis JCP8522]